MTHFHERVQERIGNVDPETLERGIFWAIENGRSDLVEYIGRIHKSGKRCFRFRVPDGRHFYAIVDTAHKRILTVYQPGFQVKIKGKERVLA